MPKIFEHTADLYAKHVVSIEDFRLFSDMENADFTDEAKDMMYANFFKSLKNKGVLFIGSTEQISNYKELGFDRLSSFYFQKP